MRPLVADLEQRADDNSRLQEQIAVLESRVETLQAQAAELSDENAALEAQLVAGRRRRTSPSKLGTRDSKSGSRCWNRGSTTLQAQAAELQEERDGLLSETERLRSELADLRSGPTPEEQRFLRTMAKVLSDLRDITEFADGIITHVDQIDEAKRVSEQPWFFEVLALYTVYDDILLRLHALSGPASVQTITNIGLEIASLVETQLEEIGAVLSQSVC